MTRAMAVAVTLAALGTGGAYAQSSVAASATVTGTLEPRDAHVALSAGVGTLVIQANSRGGAPRGTLEYVQVTRVSERGDAVIDVESESELVIGDAEEIRIVVTRVIASNS